MSLLTIIIVYALASLIQSFDQVQRPQNQLKKQSSKQQYYPFPKIIWIYWDDLKTLTSLQNIFLDKTKQVLSIPQHKDWTLNLVTNQNFKDFFTNSQQIIKIMVQKPYSTQQKSDYIRLALLQQHGGVYIDLTTILHNDLAWLSLDYLITSPIILNRHSTLSPEPQVLMTYWSRHGFTTVYKNPSGNQSNDFPGYQSYFIAAKPNSSLITDWKNQLMLYLDMGCFSIFQEIHMQDYYIGDFWYDCYFKVYLSLDVVLSRRQKQLDEIISIGQLRVTANYAYKIWTFQCNFGPGISLQGNFYHDFFQISQQRLKNKLNLTSIYFFTKLTYSGTNLLNDYRKIFLQQGNNKFNSKSLKQIYGMKYKRWMTDSGFKYLNQQSIIYKYLNNQLATYDNGFRSFSDQQCLQFQNHQINREQNLEFNIIEAIFEFYHLCKKNMLVVGFVFGILMLSTKVCQTNQLGVKMLKFTDLILSVFGYKIRYNQPVRLQKDDHSEQSEPFSNQGKQKQTKFNAIEVHNQMQTYSVQNINCGISTKSKCKTGQDALSPHKIVKSYILIVLARICLSYLLIKFSIYLLLSSDKDQYSLIFLVLLISLLIRCVLQKLQQVWIPGKFNNHNDKQQHTVLQLIIKFSTVETLLYRIFMSKIFLQLVYNGQQYVQYEALYLGFFVIEVFSKCIQFIHSSSQQSDRQKVQNFYLNCKLGLCLLMIPFMLFQSIRYVHVFENYPVKNFYQSIKIVALITTTLTTGLELFNFLNKKHLAKKSQQIINPQRKMHQQFSFSLALLRNFITIKIIQILYSDIWPLYWRDKSIYTVVFYLLVVLLSINSISSVKDYFSYYTLPIYMIFLWIKYQFDVGSIINNDIEARITQLNDSFIPFVIQILGCSIIHLTIYCLYVIGWCNNYKIVKK